MDDVLISWEKLTTFNCLNIGMTLSASAGEAVMSLQGPSRSSMNLDAAPTVRFDVQRFIRTLIFIHSQTETVALWHPLIYMEYLSFQVYYTIFTCTGRQ